MLNVAIIGMGKISLLFDYNKNSSDTAYSHVKAIFLHKSFNLKYIVDITDENLSKVEDFFPDVVFYNSYEKLLNLQDIDILVIATPTDTHFTILEYFKNSNIKLFFVEKPLFYKNEEYEKIASIFQDKIVLNYIRRFQKPIQNLKKRIETKELKNIQKITLNYVKGFKNNGTHFIDLINFLFDNPKIINTQVLDQTVGFNEDDLSYDIFFKIEYQNRTIPIHFIAYDHNYYNLIEFKLYFENRVVEYINSEQKISYYNINESKEYKGYNFVDLVANEVEYISKKLIYNVYDEIYHQFLYKKTNISSLNDEFKNFNFIKKVLEKSKD